ncbi:hypothetical protein Hanom_Chr11g01029621 [Helianthus anomalus]
MNERFATLFAMLFAIALLTTMSRNMQLMTFNAQVTSKHNENEPKLTIKPYPVASVASLEIFIFFVVPLYRSSKLHGNVRSIAAPFLGGILVDPSPVAPLN